MISKIYDVIKRNIKENYKEIIILVLLLLTINFPLDYSVMVSGGIINVNDRVDIKDSYSSKGSFNMAYVSELKGTIPTVLLSYVIPSWTKVDLDDYKASTKETAQDINNRAKVYLEYSKQSAIKTAYEKAGKKFNINSYKFYIVYVDENSKTELKPGDILLNVDGQKINSLNDYKEIINSHNIGDEMNLLIERGKTTKTVTIKVRNIDGEKMTGVSIFQLYDYTVEPKVSFKFNNNESGSSGGLMLTLAIYDKLVSEDLTKGLKVVGTGTMEFDGSVGEIDGVEYKLKGAVKQNADVFLAPNGNNYNTCIKLKEKYGYKIKIIGVSNFDDALNKLREI